MHLHDRTGLTLFSRLPVLLALCLALLCTSAFAAKPPVYLSKDNPYALQGYDPVAYFTLGQPRKGNKKHTFEYNDAVWLFTSDMHKQMFAQEPERFAPQFGGYCAFSVAQGTALQGKPEYWQIDNGKLYLNRTANIHERWLERHHALAIRANANWPAVLEGQLRSAVRQQVIEADRKRREAAKQQ